MMVAGYFTVGDDGEPTPEQLADGIMWRTDDGKGWTYLVTSSGLVPWEPHEQWYPLDPAPTEPARRDPHARCRQRGDAPDERAPGLGQEFPVGSRCRYCGGALDAGRCDRCAPLLAAVRSLDDYLRFVREALRPSNR